MDDLWALDGRIRLPGAPRECFVCGHRVEPNAATNDPHLVGSPRAGNIQLAAHGACLSGLAGWEIAARYQKAVWAACVGKKERWDAEDRRFLSR